MNDAQVKFAVIIVAIGILFSVFYPALKDMKAQHDKVIQQVSQPYEPKN
jgi:hypothetical protein